MKIPLDLMVASDDCSDRPGYWAPSNMSMGQNPGVIPADS
jgi:hypothetical protein